MVYELFGDQLAHRAIRRPPELLLHSKIINFMMSLGIQVMERRGGLCIPLCLAGHKKMPTLCTPALPQPSEGKPAVNWKNGQIGHFQEN